jgi:hypothetical protein
MPLERRYALNLTHYRIDFEIVTNPGQDPKADDLAERVGCELLFLAKMRKISKPCHVLDLVTMIQ